MENTNYFDVLPVEVLQLIFSRIADCKSLVQCMVVSKAFKKQPCQIESLSITCLGQFSSYSQKLKETFRMVKKFRSLKSLIVRIGQFKIESPTWAHCVRYVELGACIENFIFLSSKPNVDNEQQEKNHTPYFQNDTTKGLPQKVSCSNVNNNYTNGSTSTQRVESSTINTKQLEDRSCQEDYRLEDLNLRQVIAPSNDGVKRMETVIVLAIIQGLDEFRTCIPIFLECFTELKQLFFIDD